MKNKKSLGQNWLKNRGILDAIADLAAGEDTDAEKSPCLEIGPGLGTLTSSLLKRFSKVVAVEFDENLAKNLPKSFPGKNLEVLNADILSRENISDFLSEAERENYFVAANIPYYITSPIIEKLLTDKKLAQKIVLLVQKEVALRIVSEKETVLSLFVKNHAEPELGFLVGREEFTPPPKVDSAVIVLTPKEAVVDEKVFELIKAGFRSPRKKLVANLGNFGSKEKIAKILEDLGLSADARPADLHLADWKKLFDRVS